MNIIHTKNRDFKNIYYKKYPLESGQINFRDLMGYRITKPNYNPIGQTQFWFTPLKILNAVFLYKITQRIIFI